MKLPVVGDRFYRVVTNDHRGIPPKTDWVVVTKIGRKWASFLKEDKESYAHLGGRFDIETGFIDGQGFGPGGRIYDSEEAYRKAVRADRLWAELTKAVRGLWRRPEKVGEIEILRAADALGLRLESE